MEGKQNKVEYIGKYEEIVHMLAEDIENEMGELSPDAKRIVEKYAQAVVDEEMSFGEEENQVEAGIIFKKEKITTFSLKQLSIGFLAAVILGYARHVLDILNEDKGHVVLFQELISIIDRKIGNVIEARYSKIIRHDLYCVLAAIVKLKKEYRMSEFEIQDIKDILKNGCCFGTEYEKLYKEECSKRQNDKCNLNEKDICDVLAVLDSHLIKGPGGYSLKSWIRCCWGLPEEDKKSR
jgi:hypothetical protein